MADRVSSSLAQRGLWQALLSQARLAWRLLREPRVPFLIKMLPLASLVYVASPLDIVPDVIPVIGQLDDLGIVVLTLEVFLKLCPDGAVTFHRAAIFDGRPYAPMPSEADVIDAEWRRD